MGGGPGGTHGGVDEREHAQRVVHLQRHHELVCARALGRGVGHRGHERRVVHVAQARHAGVVTLGGQGGAVGGGAVPARTRLSAAEHQRQAENDAPNDAPDIAVLRRHLVLEHVLLQRRAHPERPARGVVRAQQHAVALRDGERDAGNVVRRHGRAVRLDDGQRVVVDAEADRGEGARVREPQAVGLVRLEGELRWRSGGAQDEETGLTLK